MMDEFLIYCNPALHVVLLGDTTLNERNNTAITEGVLGHVLHTKRFEK